MMIVSFLPGSLGQTAVLLPTSLLAFHLLFFLFFFCHILVVENLKDNLHQLEAFGVRTHSQFLELPPDVRGTQKYEIGS